MNVNIRISYAGTMFIPMPCRYNHEVILVNV